MKALRLHVHGMDCAEETALVRRALDRLAGIHGLDFDLINAFVDVEYDETRTTPAAISDAVRRTGLSAHEAPPLGTTVDATLHSHEHHHPHGEYSTISTVLAGVLFLSGWALEVVNAQRLVDVFAGHSDDPRASVLYALAAIAALGPMLPRALASLRHGRLDMHVLVCLSVIGAAAIGEWSEGAAVAFLFALAHRMEAWSIERARAAITALAGRGLAPAGEGTHQSAAVERWIERFAAIYTPVVTGAALVLAVVPPLVDGQWTVWFYRALVFLVLGCPCALIISTPVTVVAALTSAARRGVLIKGGAALERAAVEPEAAVQSGDVVLATAGDPVVSFLGAHARRALRVIRQNVAIALLTKMAFLVAAPFGIAPLWMAVVADTGATVIVTLNALRLLRAADAGASP